MASLPETSSEGPQQTAQIQFSQRLLFGFEALNNKITTSAQVVKDIQDFFSKRAQLEEEYSKKLTALYKTLPGTGGLFGPKDPPVTKETRGLKEALLSIQTKGLKVAEQHQEFSTKITNEICKNLDGFLKSKEADRKKIATDGQKHLKTLSDSRGASAKAKENYEKAMKETELAKEALIKAEKDEVNQPENKKLQQNVKKASQKHQQTREKAQALNKTYQESVEKANTDLQSFKKDQMPATLKELQKWEEDHWNTLLNSAKTYTTLQKLVPKAIEEFIRELNVINEDANIEDDFKEFVENHEKDSKEVEPLEYVAFKGKFSEEEESDKVETTEKKEEEVKQETAPNVPEEEQPKENDQAQKEIDEKTQKEKEEVERALKEKQEALKKTLFSDDSEGLFAEAEKD